MQGFAIIRLALWLMVLPAVGLVALIVVPQDETLHVLVPAAAAAWICGCCIIWVWKEDRAIPIVDVGVLCVIFSTLYAVIPLLNFYFGGMQFGYLSDGRLQHYRPPSDELGLFFNNHLTYLASLTSAYLVFRKSNSSLPRFHVSPPNSSTLKVLVSVYLFTSLYIALQLFVFGIGFRSGYGDESHIFEGPLWLQQINGRTQGIQSVFQAAILAFLVFRKNDVIARYFFALIIAWNIAVAFIQPGSRGELMSLLMLGFLFWHRFHGISLRFTWLFLPVVFLVFMFLGLYRAVDNLGDLALAVDGFETLASATNEFQSMLGTAFHVNKLVEGGVNIPPALLLNDFTPLLPPQQLLSFQKLTGADWYLVQSGLEGTGVGFMWSVISQSLIGWGRIELVVRGVLLGWFLGKIHEWYQRRYTKFLPTVVYVILCLASLWTFRDTTGSVLWTIWWELIPFALIFYFFGLGAEFSRSSFNTLRPRHSPRLQGAARR